MLKGFSNLLTPQLLYVLQAMGHGDEISIVDGNYPGESAGPKLVRLDGHSATDVLDAILSVMPLDTFVKDPAVGMDVSAEVKERPPILADFEAIIQRHEPDMGLTLVNKPDFYPRANRAYAIVQTSEARLYGNIVLKKGVIFPS
ncbi:L-fucose mutarotase [Ensifer adhaerens]|uniref:RbsD/FucU family protein n=1 Tax=Ensifer adhaerens TaxID=106592 RepID=UPI001569A77D|nr:RbsD/FucU domain-containing protein [Ensifer adhaerens]NRP21782.1 L-fucose mutarotase [Ensifer adhaerens]